MKYDFDKIIERKNTKSTKWDLVEEMYGSNEVIPMWVSDMDFQVAQPIIDAIKKRVDTKILGYTFKGNDYDEAVVNWMK